MQRIRMTMAQALVKFLDQQYVEVDGAQHKFVHGIFTIFGHGNVLGLGQALEQDGFINRVSRPVVPPHVEYSLTPLGEQVSAKVAALADWIELNLPAVLANHEQAVA